MQMDWPKVWYNDGITDDAALIRLSIPRSIFPSLVNKISRLLELHHMGQQSIPIPEGAIHHFLVENHSLRYGGPLHTRLQTAAVRGFYFTICMETQCFTGPIKAYISLL